MLTTPLMPAATDLLMQGVVRDNENQIASLMSQFQRGSGGSAAPAQDPRLDYLAQLGSMIMQMQQMQQGQQRPRGMQGGSGMNLGSANITGGFDSDWLGKRISAGSAEGATIGGGGSGGGKREDPLDDPHNPGRDAVTQRDYSKMKGAGRLQSGGGGMWESMKGWFK